MKRLSKPMIIIILVVIAAGLSGLYFIRQDKGNDTSKNQGQNTNTSATYTLNLTSGNNYPVVQNAELSYSIRDQNNKELKDFEVVHEKIMHMIIVRKDRTNFQHVHPEFDKARGLFTLSNFKFPTDGEYRVFADFTPSSSQPGADGTKPPTTLYKDVQVGDSSKYQPTPVGDTKLSGSDGDITTRLFEVPNDGGGSGGYLANITNSLAIAVTKNGQNYQDFDNYLGARGHMVVLGPDLEFVHAHPSTDGSSKSYIMGFYVDFPKPGTYKAFLQILDKGVVRTTDFTISARGGNTNNTSNMDHNSGH